MPSSFSWKNHRRPIVALAPMSGVTDASFRRLVKEIAPETIVYSEFLSTDAIHYGAKKTMAMTNFDPEKESPFIVQIFGKDPAHFLTAAKVIEEMGADGIDINMGCPAARVVSSCHGSALMKTPELAFELVRSAKKAVKIPVSVKTRLGWDSSENFIRFCTGLCEAGADALAIHGRTYTQKYSGKADWEPIYELKKHVAVPVIGNGDITSASDAAEKLGNLDGVMIGRGTVGNPWLMRDVCGALNSQRVEKSKSRKVNKSLDPSTFRPFDFSTFRLFDFQMSAVSEPTFPEKIPIILRHCELAVELKGEKRGMLEMRKHLASYTKGFDGARELRARLVKVETLGEVGEILCG